MILREDLNYLYNWAKNIDFPLRSTPTSDGYSSKPVKFCWIKKNTETNSIRKNIIDDPRIELIHQNPDILFSMYVVFESGTELGPHRDPDVYRERYKRIQIPINIPDKEKCYMIWNGQKVFYEEGIYQTYEVMDHIHSGYNYSDGPWSFLFVDVKKDVEVEIQ